MNVSIVPAQDVEVDYLEVVRRSPFGETPNALEVMLKFVSGSRCTFVGYADDRVACVYGLITPTLLSDRAHMWLLTTDLVDEHKFIFIRHSQVVIEAVLEQYSQIVGETSVKDDKALRWMKWLGAEFTYPTGVELVPFRITRESFRRRHD
jgi:hypothetical protein